MAKLRKLAITVGELSQLMDSYSDMQLAQRCMELDGVLIYCFCSTFFEIVQKEFTERDCLAIKGEVLKVTTFGARFHNIYKNLVEMGHPSIEERCIILIEKQIARLATLWTATYLQTMIPRPCNLGELAQFTRMLDFYNEVIESSELQNSMRDSDQKIFLCFGNLNFLLTGQIVDNAISTVSRALDKYFLTRDSGRFVKEFESMVRLNGMRLRRHHCCVRILCQLLATSSELMAPNESSLDSFLVYLQTSGQFSCTSQAEEYVEYMSNTLVSDEKKRRIFENSSCDRSHILLDHFRITVHILGSKRGLINVESRNSWAKDKWSAEMARKFNLLITKPKDSSNQELNKWIHDIQLRFETAAQCMFWETQIFEKEKMLLVDPHLTLCIYHHSCLFATEVLVTITDHDSFLTRQIWRQLSQVCARWIKATCELWSSGLITDVEPKLLSSLNMMNRLIALCPDKDLIDFRALIMALKMLQGISLSKSNLGYANSPSKGDIVPLDSFNNAGSPPKDDLVPPDSLSLLSYYTEKCLELCMNHGLPTNLIDDSCAANVKFPSLLAIGSSGMVYKCFDEKLNMAIALKEISNPKAVNIDEVNYLKFLSHRNIVDLYDVFTINDKLYLKLELCEGGSLSNLIKSKVSVDDNLFREITHQILLGIAFLHGNHIIHGDLKPGNILLNHLNVVKLADFGTSSCLARQKGSHIPVGTIQYMAPEVLKGSPGNLQSDMWSIGCTLFHFATGIPPWKSCGNPWQIMIKVAEGVVFDLTPLYSCGLQPEAIEMITSCLKFDPTERLSVFHLLLNDYLYTLSQDNVAKQGGPMVT